MTRDRVSRRFRVEGRVQGVGFRAWARDRAEALGLNGWVRNTEDGAVEALISGDPSAVERMAEALAQGPRAAAVARVAPLEAEEAPQGGFAIRR